MKFLFRHKRQDEGRQTAGVVKGVLSAYKRVQSGWASWMTRHTADFSQRTWRISLVLFVVLFGGYSLYLAVNGFTGGNIKAISITPIKKPRHATESGADSHSDPRVPEAEYSRIRQFRLYMDSLARSPSGKAKHDSIIKHRPGLMDSVRFIEKYYEQLKNK